MAPLNRTPLRGSVTQNMDRPRGRAQAPRFGFLARLGILTGVIGLVTVTAMWLWHVGWPQRQTEHLLDAGLEMTQKAHFAVKDIVVEGRQQVTRDALFAALGTSAGAPILAFDPAAAQKRIASLPWVASAVVERRLPDVIIVRLYERVPMARWQHQNKVVVIDAEGKELPEARLEQFPSLPLVVGSDAPTETQALLAALDDYPAIEQAMTAAVRVGERRWDLHLEPKVIVRLPEKGVADALKRLSDLVTGQKILERDIVAIDLRLPDRMVIEPGPGANRPAGDVHL